MILAFKLSPNRETHSFICSPVQQILIEYLSCASIVLSPWNMNMQKTLSLLSRSLPYHAVDVAVDGYNVG